MVCCTSWDERYGCVHEICPGCYCNKEHGQIVCNDCHEYNLDYKPYLDRYGTENKRKELMNYKLFYSGAEGNLSASLVHNGETVDSAYGLKDKKAVHKWAAKAARDHKVDNTPEATENHSVSVSGSKTFTL